MAASFLVLGAGGSLLGLALISLIRTRRFLKTAIDASGTVVGFQGTGDPEGTVEPVIQFEPATGGLIKFSDRVASNPPEYDVGDVVAVKYNPERPSMARINKISRLYFTPGVLTIVSAPIVGLGLLLLATGG